MDRRSFLTLGTMGAATVGGWAIVKPDARSARAASLADAAGVTKGSQGGKPVSGSGGTSAARAQGLSVGYLPGSSSILAATAAGESASWATQTRWVSWDASMSPLAIDKRVSVSIGLLQRAQGAATQQMLRSLEVIAHFAIDDAPYVAGFNAWSYTSAAGAKRVNATPPLTFDAAMPDRVGLQVNYALIGDNLAPGVRDSGMVYLPLGARDGPGTGLYVLAGPSPRTGKQPDLGMYTFSGYLGAPLRDAMGGMPDFDYVTLAIRPAAA